MNYILLWNPYEIINKHHNNNHEGVREDSWNALQQRMIEIGADDLDDGNVVEEIGDEDANDKDDIII